MIALNTWTTVTGSDTGTYGTDWPLNCTGHCRGCTMTCTEMRVYGTTVVTCTYTDPKRDDPEKQEEIYPEPVDIELVKLRRKQIFQKRFYKSNFYTKPQLKRKSMVSLSGWLTRTEYKKKRGHNKR
jgi:hypothetical protein